MAYRDLQHFIKVLEEKSLLKRIKVEVSSDLEITEIADRVSKSYGPALFFERVKDSPYPLLINSFGTYERLNLALEVEELDEIAEDFHSFMEISKYTEAEQAPQLEGLKNFFPVEVTEAACQEVEEPDLSKLPILKCWPEDGGKLITLPLVITKDPETGVQNMGMYRLQVYDEKTTGIHWHHLKVGRQIYEKYRKLGTRMPVAVALGCDPATIYSASAPLPKEIDEMVFAGFLRRSPLEIVKCKTSDIYVPANAEFILEGYVDLDEQRLEGPFGNHTGYYSVTDMYPVFHVTRITRKKNPVYPTTIVGKPPMENCYLGKANERIFLPMLKKMIPEIVEMNLPLEGIFNNCAIISIKKTYPGQAKKVMEALWKTKQMMYTKMIVIVDEAVDPRDLSTVAWKVFNNIDAKRDVVIADGPLDALDRASSTAHHGHKLGIDATKKLAGEGHKSEGLKDLEMSEEIKNIVSGRWNEYGF